ncbi:mechanosensitive ion channel family protein [Chryseobacterium lacus]|uniref:mechanosensitive ion channel family protein n=1 Tax=Chryseobacterium lacus TaxID=2058346 RepID=UPI00086AEF08|nr:mechanosensitive ion channel family protein [Chryseobacterium lacus]ODS88852.1 MAG: mechanosensitive ion channel protein MscS [Chryseobacterium sp. SCN 40-13]RST28288.1 mechanosensitive ion channel [Chryseobacterium lacus]
METGKLIQSFQDSWNNFVEQIPSLLAAILVIALGIFIANKLTDLSRKFIAGKSTDPLMTNFLIKAIKTVFVIIVIMFGLKVAGLDGIATGVLTAAGASAVILGFAFKDIGENFISGIILSFNRPFNINDTVSIGDIFGRVKSMEFRYTKLKTFDGKDVYIPNSDVIKKPVFNFTEDGYFRMEFMVGIAYENDIDQAKKIILNTMNSHPLSLKDEDREPFVMTDELGVNSVNIKVFFWVAAEDYRRDALMIRSEMIDQVKINLLTNGISMPANIQELKWYKE